MEYGALLYALLSLATALPEERGPFAFEELDVGEVSAAGEDIPVVVYRPTGLIAGPVPLVVVMHGYVRNGSFQAEMGRTLASRGMVAVVPSMPCGLVTGCDHNENAMQLSALIDWTLSSLSPVQTDIDVDRISLIGHSWGGLAVFLTATIEARVKSVVALDPNDDRSAAAMVAANALMPTAHIMAENPGACNGTNWSETVYPLAPEPRFRVRVAGSGHCDAEDPSDNFCPTFCGGGDRTTVPMFRRYAIAFTECVLYGTNGEYVGGSALMADVAAGTIDNVASAGLETLLCRASEPPPADAGIVESDAAVSEADAAEPVQEDAATPVEADAGEIEAADAGQTVGPNPEVPLNPKTNPPAEESSCQSVEGSAGVLWIGLLAIFVCAGLRSRSVFSLRVSKRIRGSTSPRTPQS
jgi:dienelactone hydrolase